MKTSPPIQGKLVENSNPVGTVTRGMVRERAVELAQINGRLPQETTHTDWDQAKRELAGDPEIEKSDAEIQTDVLAELSYDPGVKATDIGVLVKDGIVTLNGYSTSYGEKWNAVKAAKRVAGAVALVDNIELMLPDTIHHTDEHVAAAAAKQIEATTAILPGTVQITVSKGWITLEGEVEWWYQKDSANNAVLHLSGVTGVSNMISIKPAQPPEKTESTIQSAFKRNALLAAHDIQVQASDNNVSLSGDVRNHAEREEAERVAWSAPGVLAVDNHLAIKW